jgi:hypothetical protein
MHWIKARNWLLETWEIIIILALIGFIGYGYYTGNINFAASPELGFHSIYDETYGTQENFVMMRGHVTNYGNAYARDVMVVCDIVSNGETIKVWNYEAGDISAKDQAWVIERIDIPSSKVKSVSCKASCSNC